MRDRIERYFLLPFSMGCISESSISVAGQSPIEARHTEKSIPMRTKEDDHEEAEEYRDDEEDEHMKNTISQLSVPKFPRLFKNFKNLSLSQLFAYKDDDMEEEEFSMEIGLPTDVKHVTHIGIDGSATSILSKGWDNLEGPDSCAPPPVHFRPSVDLQATPAKVASSLSARAPLHSQPYLPRMSAEVPPDWPVPHVHWVPSPNLMPMQAFSSAHLKRPPLVDPGRVPSPGHLRPSSLAIPEEVNQFSVKGA